MSAVAQRAVEPRTKAKLGFPAAVRYEWIKWSTLRQSWIAALTALAILVLAGIGILALYAEYRGRMRPPSDAVSGFTGEFGFVGACLVVCILGSLSYTSEHATGSINSSLSVVPVRGMLLGAKAVIVAGAGFVIGFVGGLIGLLASTPFASRLGMGFALAHPQTWLELVVVGAVLAIFAVLGLITGVLCRSGVLSVVAIFVVLLVLPQGIALAASVGGQGMATAMAQLGGLLPSNLAGEVVKTGLPWSTRGNKLIQLLVWPVFFGWSAFARFRRRG